MKTLLAILALALLAAGGYFLLQRSPADASTGLAVDDEAQPTGESQTSSEAELLGQGNESAVRVQDPLASAPKEPAVAVSGAQKELAEPSVIFGRVIDEQGAPVAGVEVRSWEKSPDTYFLMGRTKQLEQPAYKTNAEGEFRMESKAREGTLRLRLDRSEYVSLTREYPVSGGASTDVGSIVLANAMILEGRIVDERGAGIPGVRLRVPSANEATLVVTSTEDEDGVYETNDDGSFRMDTLEPGPWRFWLHSQNHRDRVVAGEMPHGLRQRGLLWTLEDGLTLQGRVLGVPRDAAGKLAVRYRTQYEYNLQRWLGGSTAGFVETAETIELDRGLNFEIRGLHPGAMYSVGVMDAEAAKAIWVNTSAYLTQVETVAADAGEVTLQWVQRASLRFRVVDAETKAALDKVRVMPKDWEYFGVFSEERAKAEGDGVWRFDDIPVEETALGLTFSAKGYTDRVLASIKLQKGQCTDLGTLELVRGDTIQVLVTDKTTGSPVAGAEVKLAMDVSPDHVDQLTIDGDGNIEVGKSFRSRTDSQGIASIQFVPGAGMVLSVQHERYAKRTSNPLVWDHFREVAFEVKLSSGGMIECRVVDANGAPVSGRRVLCSPEEEVAPAGSPTMIRASVGGSDEAYMETTNAEGVVHFRQLAAGDYRCKLDERHMIEGDGVIMEFGTMFGGAGPEEVSPSSQVATVLEGETTELLLVEPTLGTVVGIVREDGQPLVGAKVALVDEGAPGGMPAELLLLSGGGKQTRTDAKGAYRLERVKPGKKILTITHDLRVMPAEFAMEVREGENEFSRNLAVTIVAGRAVDQDGKGVAGVTVDAVEGTKSGQRKVQMSISMIGDGGESFVGTTGLGGNRPPVVTDEQGYFRLRGVLAGKPIQITGNGEGFQEFKTEAMVLPEAAIREGIELRMLAAGKVLLTVQHANGDPWERAVVNLEAIEDADGKPIEANSQRPMVKITSASGQATFEGLAAGKYRATFKDSISMGPEESTSDALQPGPVEISVRVGGTSEATMRP